eukprot:7450244-Karenia_brevis.AAC.1
MESSGDVRSQAVDEMDVAAPAADEGNTSDERPAKKFRTTEVPQPTPKRHGLFLEDDKDSDEHRSKKARPAEPSQASSSTSAGSHGGAGEDIFANMDPDKWKRFQERVSAQRASASQQAATTEMAPDFDHVMEFSSLEVETAWTSQAEMWGSLMDVLLISSGESATDVGGHVIEVYSPPRISPVAHAAGM